VIPQARTKPTKPAARTVEAPDEPRGGWEERLGPIGIAATAILACVLAWLLTWKLF
jgi:hypothetical protein